MRLSLEKTGVLPSGNFSMTVNRSQEFAQGKDQEMAGRWPINWIVKRRWEGSKKNRRASLPVGDFANGKKKGPYWREKGTLRNRGEKRAIVWRIWGIRRDRKSEKNKVCRAYNLCRQLRETEYNHANRRKGQSHHKENAIPREYKGRKKKGGGALTRFV